MGRAPLPAAGLAERRSDGRVPQSPRRRDVPVDPDRGVLHARTSSCCTATRSSRPSTARTASAPRRTDRRPARPRRPDRRGASERSPRCWRRPSTRSGARPPSTSGRACSTSGCWWARWRDRVTDLAVIGRDVPKRDGADKVTGRTRYLHDLELPRLAHGKILRARHPHARLVRIDTTRAARAARRAGGDHRRGGRAAPVRLRQGPARAQDGQGPLRPRRDRGGGGGERGDRRGGARPDRGRVRRAAGGVRSAGGRAAGRAAGARGAADEPHRPALPVQPRRRGGRVRDGRGGRGGRVPAELRHAGLPRHHGGHRRLGRRGSADDVVHHPGAVPLPARPRPGARHRRRSRPRAAAARRRQLRSRASISTRST